MSFHDDIKNVLELFNNHEELYRIHQENFTREIKEKIKKSDYSQTKFITTIYAVIDYSNDGDDILSRLDNSTYFFEVIFL